MKKDFLTILILLILAAVGVYVSCAGTQTDNTAGNRIETTAFSHIDSVLLVATNDETAAMGCPCRKPGNLAKCKAGTGEGAFPFSRFQSSLSFLTKSSYASPRL